MEKTKTISRLSRLKRLERLAQDHVQQNRQWLQERRDELDAAANEHHALRSYRDSYRSIAPFGASAVGQEPSVSVSMLAHRQQFVSRLCHEIDQLSDREHQRALAFEQQREQLSEALSTSMGLSQLCNRQKKSLALSTARAEQARLDEAGQIQYARAVHAANDEECQYV